MNTPTRCRIGIIGAGLMGRWHAFYAKKLGLQVSVVVDQDLACAERLARKYSGCQALPGNDCNWLGKNLVDGIHICTPLDSHVQWAEVALKAGCRVVVEKPLAPSLAETEHLLALAAEMGREIVAVHQLPFQSGFQAIRKSLDLDSLRYAQYTAFSAGAERLEPDQRRKLLLEILPHPVSVFHALDLLPEHSLQWNIAKSTRNDLILTTDVRNILLQITLSLEARPTRHELTLAGTAGTAYVDFFHGFGFWDSTRVGRAGKIIRPFANGLRLLTAGGTNLARRILTSEPAYPGLRQFFSKVYSFGTNPWSFGRQKIECIHSAKLINRLTGPSEKLLPSEFPSAVGNS
jgi:predicted dehydrogenase